MTDCFQKIISAGRRPLNDVVWTLLRRQNGNTMSCAGCLGMSLSLILYTYCLVNMC